MKNPTIEELYSETVNIQVKFKEKELAYDVEMINQISKYGEILRPDCKILNFGYNQYFRTNLGMSSVKRYSSIGALKGAITKTASGKGLTVERFIFTSPL
jgi:hypothetical protein